MRSPLNRTSTLLVTNAAKLPLECALQCFLWEGRRAHSCGAPGSRHVPGSPAQGFGVAGRDLIATAEPFRQRGSWWELAERASQYAGEERIDLTRWSGMRTQLRRMLKSVRHQRILWGLRDDALDRLANGPDASLRALNLKQGEMPSVTVTHLGETMTSRSGEFSLGCPPHPLCLLAGRALATSDMSRLRVWAKLGPPPHGSARMYESSFYVAWGVIATECIDLALSPRRAEMSPARCAIAAIALSAVCAARNSVTWKTDGIGGCLERLVDAPQIPEQIARIARLVGRLRLRADDVSLLEQLDDQLDALPSDDGDDERGAAIAPADCIFGLDDTSRQCVTLNGQPATYVRGGNLRKLTVRHGGVIALMHERLHGRFVMPTPGQLNELNIALRGATENTVQVKVNRSRQQWIIQGTISVTAELRRLFPKSRSGNPL